MVSLLDTAGGLLTRRRLLTTWLPMLVFILALTIIVAVGFGSDRAAHQWDALSAPAKAVISVLFLGGTVLAAEILAAIRPTIMRLYQGYWRSQSLTAWGRARAEAARDPDRPWISPTPDRLRPTRLGNILAASEQQADRYGMDAGTVWPRLYPVLPDSFTTLLGQAASSLELLLTVSLLGAVFAVVGGVLAAFFCSWYWVPLVLGIGCALAWTGYLGALDAAIRYGGLVRTAFDVHRWLLLDAIGLRRPESWAAELDQWQQLHQLWQRGRPDSGKAELLGYPSAGKPDPNGGSSH
jgi:hypothetical protein